MASITPFLDRAVKTEDTGTEPDQCPVGHQVDDPPGGPLPTLGELLGEGVGSPCLMGDCGGSLGDDSDLTIGLGPPKLGEVKVKEVRHGPRGEKVTIFEQQYDPTVVECSACRYTAPEAEWENAECPRCGRWNSLIDPRMREPLSDFGVVKDVLALEKSHAELTRTVWIRRALEEQLLTGGRGGGPRDYWVEADCKTGEFFFHLSPAMEKDILPWYVGVKDTPRFSFFGSNGKMGCPTWDLPAGAPSIGGTCPGATAAQSVVEPAKRYGQMAPDRRSLPMPAPGAQGLMVINEANTICQSCVTGDTRVLVKGRGLIKIEDLIGVEVEVWSGVAWRKTRAVRNGVKPVVELRTNWGQVLRCTPDHQIATREDGFVPAEELDDTLQLDYAPPPCTPFPTEAALARRLEFVEGQRYRTGVDEHFPTAWGFDVGLLLGYVLGDGCVSKGEYPTVSIAHGEEDIDDLHRLKNIVAAWCSTQTAVKVADVTPHGGLVECANQRRASISWRVRGLVEFLEDAGLDKTPEPSVRRAPSGIWTASTDAVRGFLTGLFTTDGSVLVGASKVEVTLASVSEGLLRDVQQLLFAFGIKATICAYATSNEWRLTQGYNALHKLSISSDVEVRRFHTEIGFWGARKAKRLKDALQGLSPRTSRKSSPYAVSANALPHEEMVYDLVNVGEEHQFVANGLVIHNCYALEGNYPSPHVQIGEMLRYWWSRSMLAEGKGEEWVETMTRAIAALNIPRTRQGIRPIRVHSAGDFFDPNYAAAWMEVANRVWDLEVAHGRSTPEIRFWAPTRTWAAKGFDWQKISARLQQLNMIVRPSAYHVDDDAPGPLVEGWPGGTTSIINSHNKGMAPELVEKLTGNFKKVEAARDRSNGHDERFEWSCQTYAVDMKGGKDLSHSCDDAAAPDGKKGCRMCWTHPQMRVNYTTH